MLLKMPLTKQAHTLVATEKETLQQLTALALKKLVIPKAKTIGQNLMVSNVRPANAYENNKLNTTHLLALHELYESTTDWELAAELPLLYDAFHYIFQTGILVKKVPFSELQKEIDRFRQEASTQLLLAKFQLDFDQVYRFYLLRNISYYSSRYIQQVHLHEQAHWLVDTWVAALEKVQIKMLSVST